MAVRIGIGARIAPHIWIGASTPLFTHGRRLARHEGHGDGNPVVGAIVLVLLYALVKGMTAG